VEIVFCRTPWLRDVCTAIVFSLHFYCVSPAFLLPLPLFQIIIIIIIIIPHHNLLFSCYHPLASASIVIDFPSIVSSLLWFAGSPVARASVSLSPAFVVFLSPTFVPVAARWPTGRRLVVGGL